MRQILIVGLGPGAFNLLSLQTLEALRQSRSVLLRTAKHPAVDEFTEHGIHYHSCDDLYEQHITFEQVYQAIVQRVLEAAAAGEEVVYAVPGDPCAAERTVQMLQQLAREQDDLQVRTLPALGALNLIQQRLALDPGEGVLIADARDPFLRPSFEAPAPEEHAAYHGAQQLNTGVATIWMQVDTALVASDLKLVLLEYYPPEHPVVVLTALGAPGEEITTIPLEELDRGPAITHLTSLYVPALCWNNRRHTITDLRAIMALLRSERGCPWDREQHMPDLRRTVIEEAYETVDAIERNDPLALAEELGDVLLNILFLAQLGAEEGTFDFDDVVQTLADKLIRRHTHVFGDAEADTAGAVLKNWEGIKAGERAAKGEHHIFDDVPQALPALTRAQKLQKRAARVGFDWHDFRGPLLKIHEELEELSQEIGVTESWERPPLLRDPLIPNPEAQYIAANAARARTTHEVGDLFFAAVNLCRFLHLDAEEVLREANARFIRRFQRVESALHTRGQRMEELPLEELDQVWLAIKGDD